MSETITLRLKRPKAELLKKSGGNLNRWVNGIPSPVRGGIVAEPARVR